MIYFSEIVSKHVITEDDIDVGKLDDVIFLAFDQPTVTKLVIRTPKNKFLLVPIAYLVKFNSKITIVKNFQTDELVENELHLRRNLLDKQIIDIQGNKVVRVNDVALFDKPVLLIAGVDIGFLGIIRWLGLEDNINKLASRVGINLTPKFLSWGDIQPIELARGQVRLKKEQQKLEKVRPEDLADHLERTNIANVRRFLRILDEGFAARVIGNLNMNYQEALFKNFTPERAARIIELMDSDEAVDILLTISSKKRKQIIDYLSEKKRLEIQSLMDLSRTPIGELITSEYITCSPNDTAEAVTQKIKKETADYSFLTYVYVINNDNQLSGVFNLRELMMQSSDTPVYRFMNQNVIVIHLTTTKEIAIKKILKYKLQSIPVIDQKKTLIGIVALDDITESILEKI